MYGRCEPDAVFGLIFLYALLLFSFVLYKNKPSVAYIDDVFVLSFSRRGNVESELAGVTRLTD